MEHQATPATKQVSDHYYHHHRHHHPSRLYIHKTIGVAFEFKIMHELNADASEN